MDFIGGTGLVDRVNQSTKQAKERHGCRRLGLPYMRLQSGYKSRVGEVGAAATVILDWSCSWNESNGEYVRVDCMDGISSLSLARGMGRLGIRRKDKVSTVVVPIR